MLSALWCQFNWLRAMQRLPRLKWFTCQMHCKQMSEKAFQSYHICFWYSRKCFYGLPMFHDKRNKVYLFNFYCGICCHHVCICHKLVLYRNDWMNQNDFWHGVWDRWKEASTHPTLLKETLGTLRVSQTPDLETMYFTMASHSCCQQISLSTPVCWRHL